MIPVARAMVIAFLIALLVSSNAISAETPAGGSVIPLPSVQGIDGRWEAVFNNGPVQFTIVLRINTDGTGTHAVLDVPDQGTNNIPVTALAREGDQVTIEIFNLGTTYKFKLAPDGKSMSGSWSVGGHATALDFTQKAVAQSVTHTVVKGLDGKWQGQLEMGPADNRHPVAFILTIETDRNGTTGTFTLPTPDAGPSHPARVVPVKTLTREGAQIRLALPALAANYRGELAADGNTIVGTMNLAGNDQTFNLVRQR